MLKWCEVGLRWIALAGVLALGAALPASGGDVERPASVSLSEVEVSIVSTAVGLLDEGCEFGSHVADFLVRGTGEVRFEFEIFGEECPVEVREFRLTPEEVEELLNGLWASFFFELQPRYSGQPSVSLDRSASEGELVDIITLTSHALDVTVTVRLGDFEHSVRFDHGAQVPVLTPLIGDLLPVLWRRSGFQRHLPQEERDRETGGADAGSG